MADLNFATAWGGNMDPKLLAMYNKLEALAKVSGVEIKPNDPDVPNVFDGAYFRDKKKNRYATLSRDVSRKVYPSNCS